MSLPWPNPVEPPWYVTRMPGGHPVVQQALRNHYFDTLGLPRIPDMRQKPVGEPAATAALSFDTPRRAQFVEAAVPVLPLPQLIVMSPARRLIVTRSSASASISAN